MAVTGNPPGCGSRGRVAAVLAVGERDAQRGGARTYRCRRTANLQTTYVEGRRVLGMTINYEQQSRSWRPSRL
jgi:hypothetical protein